METLLEPALTEARAGLAEHGVRITVLDDRRCVALMREFIAAYPAVWNEDIGEPG